MSEAAMLANGVHVLVEPDSAIPLVDLDVVLRGGSLHDPARQEGLARLFARLLRRGTSAESRVGELRSEAFDEAIESLGAALTIDVTPSAVRLHGSVIRRNLERFLDLLAAVVVHPALRPKDLAHVRREAEAELVSQRDNDRWLAARAFRQVLFAGHPLGRSATGSQASLRRVKRDAIAAFHAERVRGADVLVALAGDVTRDEALRLVGHAFATLPPGQAPRLELTDPTPPPGLRVRLVDKPDRTQTQLFIGTIGVRVGEPSFYPLLVANTVFGGTFTARLVNEVRSKRGWSYSAQSRLYADRARDAWVLYTHPSVENARDCIALELDLVREFIAKGVSEAEVDFAKSYLVKSHAFDRDTAAKRLEPRVDSVLHGIPLAFHEQYEAHVAAVDATSASTAVTERLSARDLVVTVLGPASRLEKALRKLPGVDHLEVVSYESVAGS